MSKSGLSNLTVILFSVALLSAVPTSGQVAPVEAEGRGYPWINLSDASPVPVDSHNRTPLGVEVESGGYRPLTLARADFNEDGVPDLLCGFASSDGGLFSFHPGTGLADQPFQRSVRWTELPEAPHFLETGDFDADGHWDVILAARGSEAFWFVAGKGGGAFDPPTSFEIPGALTALASGDFGFRDGREDLILGVDGPEGARLLLYTSLRGALRADARMLDLPSAATEIAVGQLDDHHPADMVVAAGTELVLVYGTTGGSGEPLETDIVSQTDSIAALALADLDGAAEKEIVLLLENGSLILHRTAGGELGPAKTLSTAVLPGGGGVPLATSAGLPAGRSRLIPVRVSSFPRDDLLLISPGLRPLRIITRPEGRLRADLSALQQSKQIWTVDFETTNHVSAVLPMRLTKHALSSLVVLHEGESPLSVMRPTPIHVFRVNDAGTGFDGNPGDGVCATGPCEEGVCSGPCTARAAINEANTSPGHDEIRFSVASIERPDGQFGLNFIEESLTMDGCGGEPGADLGCAPGVSRTELREMTLGIDASDTVIQGMVMNNTRGLEDLGQMHFNLILLEEGVSNCHIVSNYLGTDTSGRENQGGAGVGVRIEDSSGNFIGGTNERLRNLITGARSNGVSISGTSGQNKILGNFIGTDVTGMNPLPNGHASFSAAVEITSSGTGNEIGGTEPAAGNLISGNVGLGVCVHKSAQHTVEGHMVLGNRIGVNATETAPLANSDAGIEINNASENTIGGLLNGGSPSTAGETPNPGNLIAGNERRGISIHNASNNRILGNEIGLLDLGNSGGITISGQPENSQNNQIRGNTISHNTGTGVFISAGTGHWISQNQIFENGLLGIDLSPGGVTPNDIEEGKEDEDAGPNNLQNFPLLTAAGNGRIDWTFTSQAAPGAVAYRLEFFGNTFCDSAPVNDVSFGEGETFLVSDDIPLPVPTVSGTTFLEIPARVQAITATATEIVNGEPASTSEFSNCIEVQLRDPFVVNSTRDLEDQNPGDGICDTGEKGYPDQGVGFPACTLGQECTLRAVIRESNALPGPDTVHFSIPVCDHEHIRADQNTFPIRPDGQALEEIKEALTLEADTQPGAGPRLPVVELDGSEVGDGADGLVVSGGGTTISAFIINRFPGAGIRIKNEGNNAVLGNYIGTDYLGSTFLGNGTGVVIENASENLIGDTLDEIATSVDNRLRFLTSNLISGNRTDGILITGASSSLNHIRGNLIGTTLAAHCVQITDDEDPQGNFIGIRIERGKSNWIGPANLITCHVVGASGPPPTSKGPVEPRRIESQDPVEPRSFWGGPPRAITSSATASGWISWGLLPPVTEETPS